MAKHRAVEAVRFARGLVALALCACSPEARRARDGGPGADIGNKRVTLVAEPNPHAADTTLMPGRAPAPVERFAPGKP